MTTPDVNKHSNLIHIWLNNWSNKYCPPEEPFLTWLDDDNLTLCDNQWMSKQDGITACYSLVDMSINFAVTATEEWVRKNCPILLENQDYRKKFTIDNIYNHDNRLNVAMGTPLLPLTEETNGKVFYWDDRENKIYKIVPKPDGDYELGPEFTF